MMTAADILDDQEAANMVHISLSTLQRWMRLGIPEGSIDLAAAKPVRIGKYRRWLKADLERVINERIVVKAKRGGR